MINHRPWKGGIHGGVSAMRGTPPWSRAREWGVLPPRRKEQQRQLVMMWLQPSFPHSLLTGRKEAELEIELGKKGGVMGRCLKIWVYFSLSYIWQALNYVISLSQDCSGHDSNGWMISLCPYPDPWAFHDIFSAPSSWEEWQSGLATWAPGTNPPCTHCGSSCTLVTCTSWPRILQIQDRLRFHNLQGKLVAAGDAESCP